MLSENYSLAKLFKKHIRGTPPKAIVVDMTVLICFLTHVVQKEGGFTTRKVYMNTRILKHLYDTKVAEEFEFVIRNLFILVRFPDHLYENRDSKRGDICFIKFVGGKRYICSLEKTEDDDPNDGEKGMNYVVTAFRVRKEGYLKNYKLLWSWKGDKPSS